jgi:hypothetical protein
MLRKSLLIFAVLCAAFLIGCSTSTNNSNTSTATESNKNTGVTAPATPATTTTSSSTTSGEKIGIAECDDFIAKYEDCVTKNVPEAQRSQYESSLKQWRDSWRQLAKNDMTKGTLAAACKQALESAKSSMKSYNCTF